MRCVKGKDCVCLTRAPAQHMSPVNGETAEASKVSEDEFPASRTQQSEHLFPSPLGDGWSSTFGGERVH